MIYDRTQTDVEEAIRLRKEKVQKFQELTEVEILILEKGLLTINTLNRIENKQEELKNLFNDMGYWNTPITNKSWSKNDIFNVDEFRRLIDNTNVLRNAFFAYKNTPSTPPISYHWKDINALEKILYDLDIMIDDVKNNYKECGNLQCGVTN
jgi:hypothetical protein